MAKLTFSWPMYGDGASPSARDMERLLEQNIVFQLDFLQDVMGEATRLYEEALERSHNQWEQVRKRRESANKEGA